MLKPDPICLTPFVHLLELAYQLSSIVRGVHSYKILFNYRPHLLAKEKVAIAKFALSPSSVIANPASAGRGNLIHLCPQNPISIRKAAGPLYLPGMKN